MTYTIMARMGTSNPHAVIATVITSFACSSVITGIVFFILGAFKLGSLVSFFPRHILIGCIGGVGFFLFVTGIEVSARLDGNLEYNLDTAHALFHADTVALWIIPLALSILLIVILRFYNQPFVAPAFFVTVTAVFYIVVAAVGSFNIPFARDAGWIFAAPDAGVPFYNFYSYYGKVKSTLKLEHLAHQRDRFWSRRLESAGSVSAINVRSYLFRGATCSH